MRTNKYIMKLHEIKSEIGILKLEIRTHIELEI